MEPHHWHLSWSWEANAMAQGHAAVRDFVLNLLTDLEGAGTHTVHHDGLAQDLDFQLVPQTRGGFFIVVLHSANNNGEPPLPLVFNTFNLYLAGFQFQNRWYFFSDADLAGSGHDEPGNEDYWRLLPFDGGYHGQAAVIGPYP